MKFLTPQMAKTQNLLHRMYCLAMKFTDAEDEISVFNE